MSDPTKAEIALERKALAEDRNRAAFYWEARKDGLVVRSEFDVFGAEHKLEELDGLQPYEFHAMPYRSSERSIQVSIDAGFEPIWLFCVNHAVEIIRHGERIDSALIFGRLHPSNSVGQRLEEVAIILADGTMAGFNSIDTARAVFFDAIIGAQYRAGLPEIMVGG